MFSYRENFDNIVRLMKTFKQILKSLFSNNSAIDGARKTPWFVSIILFFFGLVVSLVPVGVNELNQQLDKSFSTYNYSTAEAVKAFSENLNKNNIVMRVSHNEENKTHTLISDSGINFEYQVDGSAKFLFKYSDNAFVSEYLESEEVKNCSYFVFTSDTVFIRIVSQSDPSKDVISKTVCQKAYKKLDENAFRDAYQVVTNEDGTINNTKTIEKTWENWKILIRKIHTGTRLTIAGSTILVMAIVNVAITAILGFMIWVLTRGKQNAYRLFTVWECFKIAFWASLTPALLTCGFGFLFKGFAKTMFPLLVGIRIMWLSMKSLRPDGSGYAAN